MENRRCLLATDKMNLFIESSHATLIAFRLPFKIRSQQRSNYRYCLYILPEADAGVNLGLVYIRAMKKFIYMSH